MERGSRIADRYTLVAPLGAGRGGQVWAADDARSGTRVAIKLRHESASAGDVEVAGLRALEHPHLVHILDAGIDAGTTFIVTEIVAGGSLDGVDKPLAPAALEALAAQMLDALAYLHAHGILHADVKTENVFVASLDPPQFKLGDFGFAHRFAGGGLRGSPAFLAPEVIRGEPADERSDLYALGITLYECAFGRVPFDDADIRRVMMRQLTETPARLQDPGDVSPRLVGLLRRLLPKEAAERPADARAALASWRGEEAGLPTWVPPRLGVLIGREAEMEMLSAALARRDSVAIAIDGPPGIGKTRLLREFALRAELEGAQVDWWSPGSEAAKMPQTSRILIIEDSYSLAPQVRETAATRIRERLLTDNPALVCVTGRGEAAVFLESTLAAGMLPPPATIELGPWTEEITSRACAALLGARAVDTRLTRTVVEATGGTPGAVEFACRALVEHSLLVRGPKDVLTVPATVSGDIVARHISYPGLRLNDLAISEMQLLRLLAMLQAPMPVHWLSRVHRSTSVDLPSLTKRALATMTLDDDAAAYWVADTVTRDMALEHFAPAAQALLHDHIASAFHDAGRTSDADFHRAQGSQLKIALEALQNFALTTQALYAPDKTLVLYERLLTTRDFAESPEIKRRLEIGYLDVLFRAGYLERALDAAQRFLSDVTDPDHIRDIHNRIARIHIARADGAAALHALEPIDDSDTSMALLQAAALARLGRHSEVLSICMTVLPRLAPSAQDRHECQDLYTSALIALGKFQDAEEVLQHAIAESETTGNTQALALHLSRLGPALFYQGRVAESEAALRRSYDLFRRLGDRMNEVRVLNSLAAAFGEGGKLVEAGEFLRIAIDLSRRIGASLTTFVALSNQGELMATLGRFDEALKNIDRAILLASRPGMQQSLVPLLVCRAKTLASIGVVHDCDVDIARAWALGPDPLQQAQLWLVASEAKLIRREVIDAARDLDEGRRIFESIGARDELVQHGLLAAKLQSASGDFVTAIDTATETLTLARELGLMSGIALAELQVAEIALSIDTSVARKLAPLALSSMRSMCLQEGVWRAQHVMARAARDAEDWQLCIDAYIECVSMLQRQCDEVPPPYVDAYLAHPERAVVFEQLTSVRAQVSGA